MSDFKLSDLAKFREKEPEIHIFKWTDPVEGPIVVEWIQAHGRLAAYERRVTSTSDRSRIAVESTQNEVAVSLEPGYAIIASRRLPDDIWSLTKCPIIDLEYLYEEVKN